MGKRVLIVPVLFLLLYPAFSEGSVKTQVQGRVEMIDSLYYRGNESGAQGIVTYLKDRDLRVRSYAMKRLVDLGGVAVDTLIESLADEEVRWLVSGALINIGDESIQKVVLALKHRNASVRRNALFILRQLDARAAAPSIQKALSDPDSSVQVQAIHTVAHFGGKGALRLIMKKVDSRNIAVRDAAIEVLPMFGEEAIPALNTLLSYGNPEVRASAVQAFGAMGTKQSLLFVKKTLSDPSPTVRYYACLTLGDTGDPSVLPDVALYFDDSDPNVREAASEVFARMPQAAKPHLIRFLREGNTLQKISAATAVRKARFRPCNSALLDAIRDSSREVRVASVAALMVIADPASVEGLVNGLGDPDIRWICIMALRQFGDKNIRPLLRRTNDPELDYWKQYVLEGMGEKVLEGCLDALEKERDIGTRIATLCTMKQIKDTRAIYPIIRLMGDDKLGYVASFVLSQMGEVAVEPLLLTLEDENPVIRARAASALGEIGLERVMLPLRRLETDEDPEVRLAAERAIQKITQEDLIPGPIEPCPP
jgi:HEAT repeat protein